MSKSIELTPVLKNKSLKIVSVNFENQNYIDQLKNVGIYPGNEIFICDFKSNNILNIIVDNIQYAIRISDAKKISVEILE